jgi:soluble lytic murein transglycosylase-like protein
MHKNSRVDCLVAAVVGVVLFCATSIEIHEEKKVIEATVQPIPEVQEIEEVQEVEEIQPEEAPEATEQIDVDPTYDDIPLGKDLQVLLYQACGETNVPFELALAVIWRETNFKNISGDSGNSTGYMQVQWRWHKDRMERLGVVDLKDPYGNFLVGCDYLAELLAYDRGIEWALMAYNGGPVYANYMAEAGEVSPYARAVLNYMNDLGGK